MHTLKEQWDDLVAQVANHLKLDAVMVERLCSVHVRATQKTVDYRTLLVVPMSIDPVAYNRLGSVEVIFSGALPKSKELILGHFVSRIIQVTMYIKHGYRIDWTGRDFQQSLRTMMIKWPQDITGETKTRDRRSQEDFRRVSIY